MKFLRNIALLVAVAALLPGCTGTPAGVKPVTPFELQRYLGQWHEIARLDHRFERGLTQVTANYSMREDGGVKVINRGFNAEDNEWSEAEAKAQCEAFTQTATELGINPADWIWLQQCSGE